MSKVKADYELQTQRRNKRNAAFDAHRDLDKIKTQRDNLSELAKSLRFALCELAKYFTHCEHDLNVTIADEQLNVSECEFNCSILSNSTKRFINFKPDVTNLISAVEDPKLLEYLTRNNDDDDTNYVQISIVDCLDRLNLEANNILELSDNICKRPCLENITEICDKTDCCEDEDGLKRVCSVSSDVAEINQETKEADVDSVVISLDNLKCSGETVSKEKLNKFKGFSSQLDEENKTLKEHLDKAEEKIRLLVEELNETKTSTEIFKHGKEYFTEG